MHNKKNFVLRYSLLSLFSFFFVSSKKENSHFNVMKKILFKVFKEVKKITNQTKNKIFVNTYWKPIYITSKKKQKKQTMYLIIYIINLYVTSFNYIYLHIFKNNNNINHNFKLFFFNITITKRKKKHLKKLTILEIVN